MVAQVARAFRQAAGHGEDQRHGHVGRILGQHAGCVRYRNAATASTLHIDIVDAGAELRDEPQFLARMGKKPSVDPVRYGRYQHIGLADRIGEFLLGHGMIVFIQPDIEQFRHALLDLLGQFAGHDDKRFVDGHSVSAPTGGTARRRQRSQGKRRFLFTRGAMPAPSAFSP